MKMTEEEYKSLQQFIQFKEFIEFSMNKIQTRKRVEAFYNNKIEIVDDERSE